jgi:hypothetical protein
VALLGSDGKPLALPGRAALPAWTGRAGWAVAGVALIALTVVGTIDQVGTTTPWTYTDTVTRQLNSQVLSSLGSQRHDLVRIDSEGRGNDLASILTASQRASALLMALDKSGVPVRVSPYFAAAYGKPRGADQDQVRWVLTVVQGSRTGQRGNLVARAGDWFVYATPGPGH